VSRINGLEEQDTYHKIDYADKILTSSLIIVDRTANFNYGFSFVRELKLYSSYNFPFWDDSHHNVQKNHFEYLLHYFHNDFTQDKLSDAKVVDQVQGYVTKLSVKSKRIGYNYVKHYENLVICEEGYVYNEVFKRCDIFDSKECIVPRTSEDKCLLCGSNKPYLKDNDSCYLDCSPDYFADDYFKQCRRCDSTCYTCFGKKYNNCLSCTGIYYYIASLHICVTNCQEYGLVISTELANTCEDLISSSYISVPVYLNNSYDYNPENPDYVSKIINRDIFNRIEGHLGKVSDGVQTRWIYNRTATIEINSKYRYFDINDIPDLNPITSDATLPSIDLANDYFKYGYDYVFEWEIYSQNGEFSTSHIHRYILMMNDYPLVGPINILPSEGYITNTFLITINKCTDDVSAKNLLLYKFSYFKKSSQALDGYGNEDIYEGQYKDGERNGYGIDYSDSEMHMGEWKNNKKDGFGITYNSHNDKKYIGEWKNDEKSGFGIYYFANGEKYIGQWKNDKADGFGIFYYYTNEKYIGEWKENKRNGFGKYYYSDKSKYEGEWKNNEKNGFGIYYLSNGNQFKGNWKEDQRECYGILTYSNGDIYEGEFKNYSIEENNFENEEKVGRLYISNGAKYEGEFNEGKIEGFGIYYNVNGTIVEGKFKDE